MKIPLIVSAKPDVNFKCPRVILRTGKWSFDSNHKDSILEITVNGQRIDTTGTLELFENSEVITTFVQIGTEPTITVYACLSH